MTIIPQALVAQLATSYAGGAPYTLVDNGTTLLSIGRILPVVALANSNNPPTVVTFTLNELERFSDLPSARQTAIVTLVGAQIAGLPGTLANINLFNTSPCTAPFMIRSAGLPMPTDTGPAQTVALGYTYGPSQVIANELSPVASPRNPITTRP